MPLKRFDYLLLPLLYVLVTAACGAYVHRAHGITYASGPAFIQAMLLPVLVLATLSLLFWWRFGHFYRFPGRPLGWAWLLLPGIPITILGGVALVDQADMSWAFVALLLFALGVGIGEEVIFRGVVLGSLMRRVSPSATIWISGLIFGLAHSINIVSGQDAGETLRQVVITTLTGVVFAVYYLYVQRLAPLIYLHAVWDFILLSGAIEPGSNWALVLTFVPLAEVVAAVVIWVRHRRSVNKRAPEYPRLPTPSQ